MTFIPYGSDPRLIRHRFGPEPKPEPVLCKRKKPCNYDEDEWAYIKDKFEEIVEYMNETTPSILKSPEGWDWQRELRTKFNSKVEKDIIDIVNTYFEDLNMFTYEGDSNRPDNDSWERFKEYFIHEESTGAVDRKLFREEK